MASLICSQCGKESASLTNSRCRECEEKAWDEAFETSTDWGASVAHSDLVGRLRDTISRKNEALEILHNIHTSFNPADWVCRGCGKIFIRGALLKTLQYEEMYSLLFPASETCCDDRFLDQDYKGEK